MDNTGFQKLRYNKKVLIFRSNFTQTPLRFNISIYMIACVIIFLNTIHSNFTKFEYSLFNLVLLT